MAIHQYWPIICGYLAARDSLGQLWFANSVDRHDAKSTSIRFVFGFIAVHGCVARECNSKFPYVAAFGWLVVRGIVREVRLGTLGKQTGCVGKPKNFSFRFLSSETEPLG